MVKDLLRHKLGEVIRDYRHQKGKSLRDIAQTSNVSLSYLSEVENGVKEVSSEVLAAISKGLDVPLSDILFATAERIAMHEAHVINVQMFLSNK